MKMKRRQFVALFGSLAAVTSTRTLLADEGGQGALVEPVHRVANAASSLEPTPVHPLDRAMDIARAGLEGCRANVNDYTALLVKRERIDDTLGAHEFIFAKIRNRKVVNGQVVQPLSVYLNFLKPSTIKGREVIYVEGQNDGNIIAHEGGFKGKFLPTVTIPPNGMLAMRGQRYPLTEIGIENLIVKLIERGEKARQLPDVQCEFRKNARVKDRICTVLQVTQPTKTPTGDFYQAPGLHRRCDQHSHPLHRLRLAGTSRGTTSGHRGVQLLEPEGQRGANRRRFRSQKPGVQLLFQVDGRAIAYLLPGRGIENRSRVRT